MCVYMWRILAALWHLCRPKPHHVHVHVHARNQSAAPRSLWRPLQNDAIILTNFLAVPFVVVAVVAWLLARLLSAFVGF